MENFYTFTMIISIISFTFSATITPGPNNIMLLSSGLTFGYKKTIPHISGIIVGFPIMILLVGLGMGIIFEKFPIVLSILKIIGMLYLFWMAYKISQNKSTYDIKEDKNSKPFTFIQAATFQWVNPKSWIMALTAISIFVKQDINSFLQIIIIASIFLISAFISCNTWAIGGVILKKFIKNEKSIRIFNITMALILVISILPFILK